MRTLSSSQTLYRRPHLQARLGNIGRSTVYHHMEIGLLPSPVKIGPRAVGWPSDEIEAIIAARIAGHSDDEIKALVSRLEGARRAA